MPATFFVTNTADSGAGSLRDALARANDETTNPGADTIQFNAAVFGNAINLSAVGDNSFGPSALAITSPVTIDGLTGLTGGAGVTIARDTAVANLRLFYVAAGGDLTVQGVTLSGGTSVGGTGGVGVQAHPGGGGAGLGGAIFNAGTLRVVQCTLANNTAQGGNGGHNIGQYDQKYGGGGGGGLGVNGADGVIPSGGDGGGDAGGAGGALETNGANGGVGGGGGGGGGENELVPTSFGGTGGTGGFGGGGGGRGGLNGTATGGNGGFGGGAGLNVVGPSGTPGFGGGNASQPFDGSGDDGGGGAGLGGAIFNYNGSVSITNSAFNGGTATAGGSGPSAGSGLGGGWFTYDGKVTESGNTYSGNTGGDTYAYNSKAPYITSVVGPGNARYRAGAALDFTAHFSQSVTVDTTGGTPSIKLMIGSTTVDATYLSGSGTDTLVFEYAVQSGDSGLNGITAASPIALNGGALQAADGTNAILFFTPPNTSGVIVDAAPPAITAVTGPANGAYKAGTNLDFVFTYSEPVFVVGEDLGRRTGPPMQTVQLTIGSTPVTAAYLSGSGTNALTFGYTVQVGDADTDGIALASPIAQNGGSIFDRDGDNAGLTFTPPDTNGVFVDTTAPTVASVVRAGADPTNAGSVRYTVTFSEAVTGVDAGNFTVTPTGVTGASVTGATGSGSVYTVTVNTGAGDGSLRLDVNSGAGVQDLAGNALAGGFTGGDAYSIDKTPPAAPTVASPSAAATVNATAETVTGTAEANALVRVYSDLNNNGVIDGGDTVVGSQQLSGGATNYSVSVPLAANAANNFLVQSVDAATNSSPLTDVPTITQDAIAPSITTVAGPANGSYKAGAILDFVLTYSEAVTVAGAPRIPLTVGSKIVSADYVSGSGTNALTFRYAVQAGDTGGVALANSLDLNGGIVQDVAGNSAPLALPSLPTPNLTVDNTAPTAVMTSPTSLTTNANPIPVTVTFREAVTGFDVTHLRATNGTIGNFVKVDAHTYTFDLMPTGNGPVSVDVVGSSTVTDAAGNPIVVPAAFTRNYDGARPTVTIALSDGPKANTSRGTVTFTVTFSKDVTGFDQSDILLTGAAGGTASVTGSGSAYTVTVSGLSRDGAVGIAVADAAATDAAGNASTAATSPEVRYANTSTSILAASSDETVGTVVRMFDPVTNQVTKTMTPFPGFSGAVDTASADFNGDGVPDIVVGSGFGGGPHVKVFDGATGAELRSFFAYAAGFRGGVSVATGDVTGDGVADIVTAAGPGGGPHIEVFDGATGKEVRSFYAYDTGFTGGVSVAVGDTNGDGFADIITGAKAGGGPHVKTFSGSDLSLLQNYYAYPAAFGNGVSVAVGDTNGDGFADIVTGAGVGGGSLVKVFDGRTGAVRATFAAYDSSFLGGVNVSTTDVNGDGLADIITGAEQGGGPHVKAFAGSTFNGIDSFYATDADFLGGVFVY